MARWRGVGVQARAHAEGREGAMEAGRAENLGPDSDSLPLPANSWPHHRTGTRMPAKGLYGVRGVWQERGPGLGGTRPS